MFKNKQAKPLKPQSGSTLPFRSVGGAAAAAAAGVAVVAIVAIVADVAIVASTDCTPDLTQEEI